MNESQDLGIELDEDLLGDLPLDRSVTRRVVGGAQPADVAERNAKRAEARQKANP